MLTAPRCRRFDDTQTRSKHEPLRRIYHARGNGRQAPLRRHRQDERSERERETSLYRVGLGAARHKLAHVKNQ